MAEMLIECTVCHKKYQADERVAGKRVRCKHCGSVFDVPPLDPTPPDDELADLAALAAPDEPVMESGVDTDIHVQHPTVAPGSRLTGGYSKMQRTRDTEGYELASEEPFDDRRPNTPFVFPGAREMDDWLPWVLIAGGLGGSAWLLFSWGPDRPVWMNLLRPAVYIGLFLAIIYPLGRMGLTRGMNRAHLRPPGGMGTRALGIFALPLFLGILLWTAGGDLGSLIMGLVVGLVLAILTMWLLLRLNPQEVAPVGISGSAAFIAAAAIVLALIVGANYALLAALRSQQQLAVVTTSPLGETLPWEAPPPQPPAPAPKPRAKPPATPEDASPTPTGQDALVNANPQPNAPTAGETETQNPPPAGPNTDQPTDDKQVAETDQHQSTPAGTGDKAAPQAPPTDDNASQKTELARANDAKVVLKHNGAPPLPLNPEHPSFKPSTPIVKAVDTLDALGEFADVIYPKTTSDHLAIIRSRSKDGDIIESWSLDPLKRVGLARFNHAPGKLDHYILSPDGDLLARIVDWPKRSVQIWSFSQQKVMKSIDLDEQLGAAALLGFVNNRQFVVLGGRGNMSGMEYLDAFTGRSLRQVNLSPGRRDARSFVFGPKGLFIATTGTINQAPCIVLYSFPSGQTARWFKLNDLDPRGPIDPAGMAFSPDGNRLAVLFEQYGNGLLLCWDIFNYSKPPLKHLYPNGFGFNISNSSDETAIQWLDKDAWLLWGRGIYDTDTGKSLGRIGLDQVVNQRLIKPQTIQLTVSDPRDNSRRMMSVRVNPEQLASARQAAAQ